MSFRSRTRSKPVVPVRRSTSLTRPSSSSGSSRAYTPSSAYAGYQSGSNYLNPYHTGLDPSSYSPRNSGYFDYGSSSSGSKRRDSYGGSNTSLNALMYSNPLAQNPYSYKSPYKDRDRYGNNSTASYTSPYSNRYVSPYSTYENGVTTAGLSFHPTAGHSSSSSVGTNLTPTSKLSTSNTSLNHYLTPSATAHLGRSASLRDQERKSRNRNRKQATSTSTTSQTPTPRSLSVSSVHSDIGYEVGDVCIG